jgi:hypothetical protein
MRATCLALLILAAAAGISRAAAPFPDFKVQEIDKTLKVGYGVRVADVNGDQLPDIVVADSARVIWFDNAGGWKLHTVIDNAKAGVKVDNVCLDLRDLDHDGKLDIALGADWQPNNTKSGGSLQWLRQGKTPDEWTVHAIADSIPTLHRIHFDDVDGDGKDELLVGALKGKNSTDAANFMDVPVQLLAYKVPADPTGKWDASRVLTDKVHVMHNFRMVKLGAMQMILTASYEGVGALKPAADASGPWEWTHIGAGNQENPKGARGSSEVKPGFLQGQPAFFTAIEPLHGHELVMYRFRSVEVKEGEAPPPQPLADRLVIDDTLKAGHALWCADLDGDGLDEIIAGYREPGKGAGPGINVYKGTLADGSMTWEKHVLDDKGIACEDLACADLDGDGKTDIVAVGRATGNVRIYWNRGR